MIRRALLASVLLAALPAGAQDPPGPVDPNQPLPPGHPPVEGASPMPGGPSVHHAMLPQSASEDSPALAEGTVVVRVVDARGAPVSGAPVRLGAMREGERDTPREAVTGADGEAHFQGLPTGSAQAYRASTEYGGAKFGAMPFQLGEGRGHRVQLVRFDIDREGRGVLLWDARVEMRFRDDRLLVVERMHVANLSAMSLGDEQPHPAAYVPGDGLRFELPPGFTAFTSQPSMEDVRVTAEGSAAVLRGSIIPTVNEPTEVMFQYQVKLDGGSVSLHLGLPLPVVNAMVAVEAPRSLVLSVAGMPAPERREGNGERILITGLQRQPNDTPVRAIDLRLDGIPSPAGPARGVATGATALLILGGIAMAVQRRGAAAGRRGKPEIEAERDRAVAEARELDRRRDAGDVGPVTYEERRREIVRWLASLLRELDELTPAKG